MLNKKVKVVIVILLILVIGYVLRLDRPDRFGFAQIKWEDCVQINNIIYNIDINKASVEQSLIDKKIEKIKFNVANKVHNPSYCFRNGDATFLPVGTEIYSLKSDNNAITVKIGEQYLLYKRDMRE